VLLLPEGSSRTSDNRYVAAKFSRPPIQTLYRPRFSIEPLQISSVRGRVDSSRNLLSAGTQTLRQRFSIESLEFAFHATPSCMGGLYSAIFAQLSVHAR